MAENHVALAEVLCGNQHGNFHTNFKESLKFFGSQIGLLATESGSLIKFLVARATVNTFSVNYG